MAKRKVEEDKRLVEIIRFRVSEAELEIIERAAKEEADRIGAEYGDKPWMTERFIAKLRSPTEWARRATIREAVEVHRRYNIPIASGALDPTRQRK